MLESLAEVLVNKKILVPDMEVDVEYMGLGLEGMETVPSRDIFYIKEILNEADDSLLFVVSQVRDNTVRRIKSKSIVGIDGMDPGRFALAYDLTPSGAKIVLGKRRGRRPKIRKEEDNGQCDQSGGISTV